MMNNINKKNNNDDDDDSSENINGNELNEKNNPNFNSSSSAWTEPHSLTNNNETNNPSLDAPILVHVENSDLSLLKQDENSSEDCGNNNDDILNSVSSLSINNNAPSSPVNDHAYRPILILDSALHLIPKELSTATSTNTDSPSTTTISSVSSSVMTSNNNYTQLITDISSGIYIASLPWNSEQSQQQLSSGANHAKHNYHNHHYQPHHHYNNSSNNNNNGTIKLNNNSVSDVVAVSLPSSLASFSLSLGSISTTMTNDTLPKTIQDSLSLSSSLIASNSSLSVLVSQANTPIASVVATQPLTVSSASLLTFNSTVSNSANSAKKLSLTNNARHYGGGNDADEEDIDDDEDDDDEEDDDEDGDDEDEDDDDEVDDDDFDNILETNLQTSASDIVPSVSSSLSLHRPLSTGATMAAAATANHHYHRHSHQHQHIQHHNYQQQQNITVSNSAIAAVAAAASVYGRTNSSSTIYGIPSLFLNRFSSTSSSSMAAAAAAITTTSSQSTNLHRSSSKLSTSTTLSSSSSYVSPRSEFESLMKRYAELDSFHVEVVTKLSMTEAENRQHRKRNDEILQQLNQSMNVRECLQDELNLINSKYEKAYREIRELQDQLAKVKKQRDEANKECHNAMNGRNKANRERQQMYEERNVAMREYTLIMSERDSVHKEIEKLQEDLQDVQKKHDSLEKEYKMTLNELESLRRELASALLDRDRALKTCNDLREKYGESRLTSHNSQNSFNPYLQLLFQQQDSQHSLPIADNSFCTDLSNVTTGNINEYNCSSSSNSSLIGAGTAIHHNSQSSAQLLVNNNGLNTIGHLKNLSLVKQQQPVNITSSSTSSVSTFGATQSSFNNSNNQQVPMTSTNQLIPQNSTPLNKTSLIGDNTDLSNNSLAHNLVNSDNSENNQQLREQVKNLQLELQKATQEIDAWKIRRDWAIAERDKIVLERESVRALCDKLRRERDRKNSDLADALRESYEIRRQKNETIKELELLKEKFDSMMKANNKSNSDRTSNNNVSFSQSNNSCGSDSNCTNTNNETNNSNISNDDINEISNKSSVQESNLKLKVNTITTDQEILLTSASNITTTTTTCSSASSSSGGSGGSGHNQSNNLGSGDTWPRYKPHQFLSSMLPIFYKNHGYEFQKNNVGTSKQQRTPLSNIDHCVATISRRKQRKSLGVFLDLFPTSNSKLLCKDQTAKNFNNDTTNNNDSSVSPSITRINNSNSSLSSSCSPNSLQSPKPQLNIITTANNTTNNNSIYGLRSTGMVNKGNSNINNNKYQLTKLLSYEPSTLQHETSSILTNNYGQIQPQKLLPLSLPTAPTSSTADVNSYMQYHFETNPKISLQRSLTYNSMKSNNSQNMNYLFTPHLKTNSNLYYITEQQSDKVLSNQNGIVGSNVGQPISPSTYWPIYGTYYNKNNNDSGKSNNLNLLKSSQEQNSSNNGTQLTDIYGSHYGVTNHSLHGNGTSQLVDYSVVSAQTQDKNLLKYYKLRQTSNQKSSTGSSNSVSGSNVNSQPQSKRPISLYTSDKYNPVMSPLSNLVNNSSSGTGIYDVYLPSTQTKLSDDIYASIVNRNSISVSMSNNANNSSSSNYYNIATLSNIGIPHNHLTVGQTSQYSSSSAPVMTNNHVPSSCSLVAVGNQPRPYSINRNSMISVLSTRDPMLFTQQTQSHFGVNWNNEVLLPSASSICEKQSKNCSASISIPSTRSYKDSFIYSTIYDTNNISSRASISSMNSAASVLGAHHRYSLSENIYSSINENTGQNKSLIVQPLSSAASTMSSQHHYYSTEHNHDNSSHPNSLSNFDEIMMSQALSIQRSQGLLMSSNQSAKASFILDKPLIMTHSGHHHHHSMINTSYGSIGDRNSYVSSNGSGPQIEVKWIKCAKDGSPGSPILDYRKAKPDDYRQITIDRSSASLGIRILRTLNDQKGVFVEAVTEGSLAQQAGICIGDQIIDICGINMRTADYENAAKVLKQCRDPIQMLVQKNCEKFKDTFGQVKRNLQSNELTNIVSDGNTSRVRMPIVGRDIENVINSSENSESHILVYTT